MTGADSSVLGSWFDMMRGLPREPLEESRVVESFPKELERLLPK